MAINFASPTARAGSGDLTISISPLGLVELSDEEFEVHSPRLNRYALAWAMFLGHHWSSLREAGEPQLTFNYCRSLSEFITNFTFGKGIGFRSPKSTEAIVPQVLQEVWEVDNNKEAILFETGQTGSVAGDVFIKTAWEPPFTDPAGWFHPGRVRILPVNPAHAFPEWHPHDRTRLIRFKMRYRFWGTAAEGTRQVFTYTELITDEAIEEYLNDELIDSRPNPLGRIPIVHVANLPVAGSPWGLSDIHDILSLNREYNEKATNISDMINYHAAPVTIITGAKAANLEKGPRKVWGGMPSDAKVYNLEGLSDLSSPLAFLELLKAAMHEFTGVPMQATAGEEAISNTSGVALAMQLQPLMNRYVKKKMQYGRGFEQVNEHVLMTLATYAPERLLYDPTEDVPLKDGQLAVLDLNDPITYRSTVHWPEPLPLDKLIMLNELMTEMQLGLESKTGALRKLGYEFPDEKMNEIFLELVEDAKMQGALDLIRAQISSSIMALTGMQPDGMPVDSGEGDGTGGGTVTSAGGSSVTSAGGINTVGGPLPGIGTTQDQQNLMAEIVTLAAGTKIPQRRNPNNDLD